MNGVLAEAVQPPYEKEAGEMVPPPGSLKSTMEQCNSFTKLGCILAWWLICGDGFTDLEPMTHFFIDDWIFNSVAESRSSPRRAKGMTFPIRAGELEEFIQIFQKLTFAEMLSDKIVESWKTEAWTFSVICSLNKLAGCLARPHFGRWTAAERRAVCSIRESVGRRIHSDKTIAGLSERDWQKDLSSRHVGYNGEEISTCHELTWDQVLPSLPLEEHGGSVDALDWVGPKTKEFLQNPSKLLKDPKEVVLPRMPGRIHMAPEDRNRIAFELVKRNVCSWVPLSKVYRVNGVPVLNGLFGVVKPSTLQDGRPILRLIMNLTGTNATQHSLEGGCRSLPAITTWQSTVIDQGETLTMFQSDMSSAFYLFKIPKIWHGHLAFNILIGPDELGFPGDEPFALCCNVIPMGWLNSVGIMQEISEQLLLQARLNPFSQIVKGKLLPPWLNDVLNLAEKEDRAWWHVYLDNFAAAECTSPNQPALCGELTHAAAEKAWGDAGVISSSKKRVSGEKRITELGAEIDGETGSLGVSTEKLLRLCLGTMYLACQPNLNRKFVQIIAGRWMFVLQFRRPAMSVFNHLWKFVGGSVKVTRQLIRKVRTELVSIVLLAPTLRCNLRARVDHRVTASDASQSGYAVAAAENLTTSGLDFLGASQKLDCSGGTETLPVLLVSLFNGIGGCFRCYDIVGPIPIARIAVECDAGANRITSRRWPDCMIVDDVRKVDKAMIQSWARQFLGIREVHLWAGFPCTDLSSLKWGRQNLQGSASSLFWEVVRILALLREEFEPLITVKHVLENVASMDASAAQEVSSAIGSQPYKLDPVDAVPMRRPRFSWCSETLERCFPDIEVTPNTYWSDVKALAEYPSTDSWLEPGHEWKGEKEGTVFPTCLKCIVRTQPPPRPAGLERCSEEAKRRWAEDQFRYPPYQYDDKFVITSSSTWRLLSVTEKELLMGYGYGHTEVAMPASKIKSGRQKYFDARHSYIGDSFSIYSFVIMAMLLCKNFIPRRPYSHLAHRMGLAPGFAARWRSIIPLTRSLGYGSIPRSLDSQSLAMEFFNRFLLRHTNHTGSDVRVVTGQILNPKTFPRQSVASSWWDWKGQFFGKWAKPAHINVLELSAILKSINHQVRRFQTSDSRIFHLSDSYVCISIVSKGRSSSQQMHGVMKLISATLLAHGLFLVLAHVESTDNPTDEASRL